MKRQRWNKYLETFAEIKLSRPLTSYSVCYCHGTIIIHMHKWQMWFMWDRVGTSNTITNNQLAWVTSPIIFHITLYIVVVQTVATFQVVAVQVVIASWGCCLHLSSKLDVAFQVSAVRIVAWFCYLFHQSVLNNVFDHASIFICWSFPINCWNQVTLVVVLVVWCLLFQDYPQSGFSFLLHPLSYLFVTSIFYSIITISTYLI